MRLNQAYAPLSAVTLFAAPALAHQTPVPHEHPHPNVAWLDLGVGLLAGLALGVVLMLIRNRRRDADQAREIRD